MIKKIISSGILLSLILAAGCGINPQQSDEARAHYMLGLSYLREDRMSQAMNEFRMAEEINPKDPEIQAALGQVLHVKEAYPEAERRYLQAVKLSHEAPRFLNNLGALYLDMERWDDAIRYFKATSSRLDFDNPEVPLSGIGYAYLQKGDYLQAVTFFKEAISTERRYAPAYLGMGQAYYALDKTTEAVAQYREALAIAPNYAQAHYQLGLAQVKLRQTEEAVASFNEVIRLIPDTELGKLSREHLKVLK
ncbi:tetratricopeptide repeat protein [Desulfuromonas sp. AOP6]|uniref:tetratricopeptide repeat protein n=1 Tax=Desulfuromonas sp. AOP6 TaxID=1566351 RepID=UPI00128A2129|nr:tetratricopeptide repeat protein [Desulfuromonas sp. AOP6]BCA79859.1 lipoprotein [Desulfuromonas sp. AOP6]